MTPPSDSITMAAAAAPSTRKRSSHQTTKRVRFDERCRVRPIQTLQNLEPQVRELMWYNREELKAIRKECKTIMKEALHQLQRAQAKQKKKQAEEKLLLLQNDEMHPFVQEEDEHKDKNKKKNNKAKHLFPPSAFRGLEMFHPKMSFKREGRRQEQWEVVLTEQAQQDMARSHESSSSLSLNDNGEQPQHEEKEEEEGPTKNKRLPKEKDLIHLAELSLNLTQIATKEAHRRALRDQQDLLHPPKYWMLPWLLKEAAELKRGTETPPRTSEVDHVGEGLGKLLQLKHDHQPRLSPTNTAKLSLSNASELKNHMRTVT